MSVYEDWWIREDGSVKQMGQSEHAAEALREMLLLPEDYHIKGKDLFGGIKNWPKAVLTAAKKKGADPKVFEYLEKGYDPRLYMIKERGWVRVSKDKMNVWKFDDKTLDLIRSSEYWSHQPQVTNDDMFDIDELSTKIMFGVSVGKLRRLDAEAEALKRMATGVGRFLNPLDGGFRVHEIFGYTVHAPTHLPGRGVVFDEDEIEHSFEVDEAGNIAYEDEIPKAIIAEIAKFYV